MPLPRLRRYGGELAMGLFDLFDLFRKIPKDDAFSCCGGTGGHHLGGCRGGTAGPGGGRHAKNRQCGFTWTTTYRGFLGSGTTYHVCGNKSDCDGMHLCRNFGCKDPVYHG
jgi:hypothetical protein